MPFIKPYKIPKIDAPLERCYWVVENLLLAGAYPGHPNSHAHTKRISGLWEAGMRTFINLMEEGETNNAGQAFVRVCALRRCAARIGSEKQGSCCSFAFPCPRHKDHHGRSCVKAGNIRRKAGATTDEEFHPSYPAEAIGRAQNWE